MSTSSALVVLTEKFSKREAGSGHSFNLQHYQAEYPTFIV